MSRYSFVIVILFASLYLAFASYLPSDHAPATSAEFKYSRAHSLDSEYTFDPRDGWQTVNISHLSHQHTPRTSKSHKANKTPPNSLPKVFVNPAKNAINGILKGLKGTGKTEEVSITWYTGHDLLNPSCWEKPVWAPTDHSFACAVTMDGWASKPKCFQFLELCRTEKKCVFVRVVDSCAGCAKGSKHVDLTKGAFAELADLSEGIATVAMRLATEPLDWVESLWGPKDSKGW